MQSSPGEGDRSPEGGGGGLGEGLPVGLVGVVMKVGVVPNGGWEGCWWVWLGFRRLCSESAFTSRASSTIFEGWGRHGD